MSGWTGAEVVAASDAWIWEPPGSQRQDVDGVVVVAYPEWARLGCLAIVPSGVTASGSRGIAPTDLMRSVTERVTGLGRSEVTWSISPGAPDGLEAALRQAGATLTEELVITGRELDDTLPEPPSGLVVRVVEDDRTLADAEEVAAAVWGGEPSGPERRAQQLVDIGEALEQHSGFRIVVYDTDERPISTGGCELARAEGHGPRAVARLWSGATLESARGQGAYRALVLARLHRARHVGASLGLVQARIGTSGPILSRMGFVGQGEIRQYRLTVA